MGTGGSTDSNLLFRAATTTARSEDAPVPASATTSFSSSSPKRSSDGSSISSATISSQTDHDLQAHNWKVRVQHAAQRLWLSPETIDHWSYFDIDARLIAIEWSAFTLLWIAIQRENAARCTTTTTTTTPATGAGTAASASACTDATQREKRLCHRFIKYVHRFQAINDLVRTIRLAEYAAAQSKYYPMLASPTNIATTGTTTNTTPATTTKQEEYHDIDFDQLLQECDALSLLYDLLKQRPEVMVNVATSTDAASHRASRWSSRWTPNQCTNRRPTKPTKMTTTLTSTTATTVMAGGGPRTMMATTWTPLAA